MAAEKGAAGRGDSVGALTHRAKRKNLPPAGLESQGKVGKEAPHRYEFNPHLPPVLRSAPGAGRADRLPELLRLAGERALTGEERQVLGEALRRHEPWLEWAGKRERPWFEVDPVALHMHERVSTRAMLRALRRKEVNRSLFGDPDLEYAKAVQFYRHDVEWTNRLILGDSLQVMASLARREDLAGKVQMIYVDPPYGINYKSNFQPDLHNVQPQDKDTDLTREPEMVRAYRDTWTLGVHSYLEYLRARLKSCRELLSESGSLFVQISDENLHRVRCLLDEVFGPENFITQITFTKKGSQSGDFVPPINEYVIWYVRDRSKAMRRFRPLFNERSDEASRDFRHWETQTGETLTSEQYASRDDAPVALVYSSNALFSQKRGPNERVRLRERIWPSGGNSWKIAPERVPIIDQVGRVLYSSNRVRYKRYAADFRVVALSNVWTDLAGTTDKIYAVQTNPTVVERCMLMTTDPGDLVLDPTCGSGTTAFVAEKWGRRWITIDTSRVALTLAKHRMLTAKYEHYRLRRPNSNDLDRNPDGPWLSDSDDDGLPTGEPMTLDCRTVPHITLRSIARNASLDPILQKHEPVLERMLEGLNTALDQASVSLRAALVAKLIEKHRSQGARSVTDGDLRRWLLPGVQLSDLRPERAGKGLRALTATQIQKYRERAPSRPWREWEVPFDSDPDWPEPLREALAAYRKAWRAKMDEVNECIRKNAESEELVDRPEVDRNAVRVAGPFSVEGVIAPEEGPDTPIGGDPDALEAYPGESEDLAARNGEAHLAKVIRLLRASGVEFAGNGTLRFRHLEAADSPLVHAEGEWENGAGEERRVAVSIGPEFGNLTAMQVEGVLREANRAGYDEVVFAGFGFDAAAQEAIENDEHPNLKCHLAVINPDVAMGELLKTQPGSQIFTVFAAPRVTDPRRSDEGEYTVEMEGMDVYDPVGNEVHPTDRKRVAAWFLDADYDGRTFCICQAFFPDNTKWDALARALGDLELVEREAFRALRGFTSLPIRRPERLGPGAPWRIAVKVIDPRGVEGLRVLTIPDPPTDSP